MVTEAATFRVRDGGLVLVEIADGVTLDWVREHTTAPFTVELARRRSMRDAVICEPVRTPVGGFGGALRDVPAHELAAIVIRAVLDRTGLPGDAVDDVVLGHSYPTMDAPAIGRVAALDAGLPVTVTGSQVDRRCGSGLQAVLHAAMQVQTGVSAR